MLKVFEWIKCIFIDIPVSIVKWIWTILKWMKFVFIDIPVMVYKGYKKVYHILIEMAEAIKAHAKEVLEEQSKKDK